MNFDQSNDQVIRNREYAETLFINEIRIAKSEILIASSSLEYLKYLSSLGFIDSLEQAKSRGLEILILCPEFLNRESKDLDQYSNLILDIRKYALVRNLTGQIKGSLLIVDNSKVLSISEEGIDALAIYSSNPSLVNNFGSLFESLWLEKDLIQDLIKSKNELIQTNEKLKLQDKLQKEFINIAAHELRTPIQPILGMLDMMELEFRNKNKIEVTWDDIVIILRNAQRLEKLSFDILEVAKIESTGLTIHKEKFNIDEIISKSIEDFRTLIKYEDKNIKLHYAPKKIIINADKVKISQVIDNLLNNSIKCTGSGDIYLLAYELNDYLNISIKDTGSGIKEEMLPRLFTKFGSNFESGTGLGLFISKNIIDMHGGKIWGENNRERGATFTFTLPL